MPVPSPLPFTEQGATCAPTSLSAYSLPPQCSTPEFALHITRGQGVCLCASMPASRGQPHAGLRTEPHAN